MPCHRTRGSGQKRLCLNIRRHSLPWEVVESPSWDIFKSCLDTVLWAAALCGPVSLVGLASKGPLQPQLFSDSVKKPVCLSTHLHITHGCWWDRKLCILFPKVTRQTALTPLSWWHSWLGQKAKGCCSSWASQYNCEYPTLSQKGWGMKEDGFLQQQTSKGQGEPCSGYQAGANAVDNHSWVIFPQKHESWCRGLSTEPTGDLVQPVCCCLILREGVWSCASLHACGGMWLIMHLAWHLVRWCTHEAGPLLSFYSQDLLDTDQTEAFSKSVCKGATKIWHGDATFK